MVGAGDHFTQMTDVTSVVRQVIMHMTVQDTGAGAGDTQGMSNKVFCQIKTLCYILHHCLLVF